MSFVSPWEAGEIPVVYQKQPGIHNTTKEKGQYPFLYKNILFKRQFKSKNSVQHREVLFFVISEQNGS